MNDNNEETSKSILILSDEDDATTDDVLDWLDYFEEKYLRINGSNCGEFSELRINEQGQFDFKISFDNYNLIYSQIRSYWYRRGRINLDIQYLKNPDNQKLENTANFSLERECQELLMFFHLCFEKLHGIGTIFEKNQSKIQNIIT